MMDDFSLITEQFSLWGYLEVGPQLGLALDVATALSVFAALVFFFFNQRSARRNENRQHERDLSIARTQHTIELLSIMNQDGPVFDAQLEMALWIKKTRRFADDAVTDDEDRIIIAVLDFYDFVSWLMNKEGEDVPVDRETVVFLLGGRMRDTWFVLERYVDGRRRRLNRPKLYEPFETAVREHIGSADV